MCICVYLCVVVSVSAMAVEDVSRYLGAEGTDADDSCSKCLTTHDH